MRIAGDWHTTIPPSLWRTTHVIHYHNTPQSCDSSRQRTPESLVGLASSATPHRPVCQYDAWCQYLRLCTQSQISQNHIGNWHHTMSSTQYTRRKRRSFTPYRKHRRWVSKRPSAVENLWSTLNSSNKEHVTITSGYIKMLSTKIKLSP